MSEASGSAAPVPPLTAKEVRAELRRLQRIIEHVEKLSDPGKRWLMARLAHDIEGRPL